MLPELPPLLMQLTITCKPGPGLSFLLVTSFNASHPPAPLPTSQSLFSILSIWNIITLIWIRVSQRIGDPAWQSAGINMLPSREPVFETLPKLARHPPPSCLAEPSRERLLRPTGTKKEQRPLCRLCDQKINLLFQNRSSEEESNEEKELRRSFDGDKKEEVDVVAMRYPGSITRQ